MNRALVLGGGGATGNAWLIGVVAGLLHEGLDVTAADTTVGTSAGSTAAAQLVGANPAELLTALLAAVRAPPADPPTTEPRGSRTRPVVDHLERTNKLLAAARNPADMRRRLGQAALQLDASSNDRRQAQWRATVAARLPSKVWPQRTLLITAVDAHTGEPVVFDRHSGADLVDAVAASCAGGFAYRIGDRYFIDGGYRSNAENADLAGGHRRALVLSPLSGRSRTPPEWGLQLAVQLEELRSRGCRVTTIFPDRDDERLFGVNAMDLSLRPSAAAAGYRRGMGLAEQIGAFWR